MGPQEKERGTGFFFTEDGQLLGTLDEWAEIYSESQNNEESVFLHLPDKVTLEVKCKNINWDHIQYVFLGIRTPKMKKWERDYRRCLHRIVHSKRLIAKKNVSRALKMLKKAKKRWGFIPY